MSYEERCKECGAWLEGRDRYTGVCDNCRREEPYYGGDDEEARR